MKPSHTRWWSRLKPSVMVGDKKTRQQKNNWLILEQEAGLVFKFRNRGATSFGPEGGT